MKKEEVGLYLLIILLLILIAISHWPAIQEAQKPTITVDGVNYPTESTDSFTQRDLDLAQCDEMHQNREGYCK